MSHPLIDEQFQALAAAALGAQMAPTPDGGVLITLPNVSLPAGWSADKTDVHFVLPLGFPHARPDCFWADGDLRLAGGALPTNSGVQDAPYGLGRKLWFSWHVANWNPNVDTITTYLKVVLARLKQPR